MIIFTVTNKTTSQVYVGTTRNDLLDQWDKMVAAAEQNLNYPLYQEIRTHGSDGFVVEEWDYVEDRSELAALEQEAIESFNAKSLRGYKTSTVKIQPKKKTRTRKSSIEKELANIFAEVVAESKSDDEPPSLALKNSQTKTADKQSSSAVKAATVSTPKPNAAQLDSAMTSAVNEALEQTRIPKDVTKPAAPELPDTCSQANAVVQMKDINLSDDINAQLAAIQAAADAVLAGDSSAAADLSAPVVNEVAVKEDIQQAVSEESQPAPAVVAKPQPAPEPEPVVELDPKQQRIRDAVERQRRLRAQKTADKQREERQHIASLLAELMDRANALQGMTMIAAA